MLKLREIVEAGLCIGCGLCASIGDGVTMQMTTTGVERPTATPLPAHQLALINAVCPGLMVELDTDVPSEPIWGPALAVAKGHAADPEVRYQAATGGVLTALGQHLVASGRVKYVLHVTTDRTDPLSWIATTSRNPNAVLAGSGSRYGPVAPLTGFIEALAAGERFAVVVKPCDAAAVRNLAKHDPRVGELVDCILVLVCGGASKMTKSWALLEDMGLEPSDVASIRYRGYGNPGPTTVVASSGDRYETSYLEMWEDEGTWDLQWRCKVCPDGMGEVADLVALDCWPGGAPSGEDEGYNGIIARTPVGVQLLEEALAAGVLVTTEEQLPINVLEVWQPHQSRRKKAVAARLAAMSDAGLPTLSAPGMQVDRAGAQLSEDAWRSEYDGAADRIARGAHRDPMPD